jgi:DNA polymerase I
VPGIGPKGAAELINRFGSVENVLAHAAEVKGKKGEALQAAREAVRISHQLVTLRCDVPLPLTVEELRRQPPDRPELRAMLAEFEFFRIITQEKLDDKLDGEVDGRLDQATDEALATQAAPAVLIEVPSVPVEIVRDEAGLQRLFGAVAAAGRCGLSLLSEGGEATRADFVGLAVATPEGPRFYVPLGHRLLGEPTAAQGAELLARLAPWLADEAVAKSLHDSKFLEVLLALRGYRLEGVEADTLLAGYLLDASRNRHDLELVASAMGVAGGPPRASWLGTGRTSRAPGEIGPEVAAERLGAEAATVLVVAAAQRSALRAAGLDQLYLDLELPLSRVLSRIEAQGIRIDSLELGRLGEDLDRSIAALEAEIHGLAGTTFNIGSPKQLGEVLFGKLGLPVVRRTKTGPSTDADVLEELAALHEVPAKIVEYRGLTKLKSTYIEALPALVHRRTGRLHTTFNQAVAATGRLSSSEPNLQNIPIRTEVGRQIRQAFIADPGYQIVSADYSQIELRILAHFSEDPAFLEAFRSGADIHQRTAAEVFNVPPESVSAEQRRVAKAINFGLVFGQSEFGLAQTLRIPRATAKAYIASYFERYAGVRAYMERTIVEARETGGAITLLGRRRPIPEMISRRPQERAHAERVARNTPIQGSAADILKLAMIRVDAGLRTNWPEARLLLTVHDELVFEVPEPQVAEFSDWVRREMQNVYLLRVPLVVDVGGGRTWGQAH